MRPLASRMIPQQPALLDIGRKLVKLVVGEHRKQCGYWVNGEFGSSFYLPATRRPGALAAAVTAVACVLRF